MTPGIITGDEKHVVKQKFRLWSSCGAVEDSKVSSGVLKECLSSKATRLPSESSRRAGFSLSHPLNNFSLDADTAGYLFTFLPDLFSLISASPSCQIIYGIFQLNQIGPTFPEALRLARTEAAGLHKIKSDDLLTEDFVLSFGITRKSAIFGRNAEVVTKLKNLFSGKITTTMRRKYYPNGLFIDHEVSSPACDLTVRINFHKF
ncbi:hypothetical protein BYT27DRAFT_7212988 [Phlegmacium glaucopus]|nr:hypothetical protein BYT27DRAFT_7212988 [Phlegmacium glaucopus]